MVIVDTSVLVAYLDDRVNPQTEWLERHMGSKRAGITTLILAEVLQGIRSDKLFLEMSDALNRFEIFNAGDQALALAAACNYRTLRKMGITVRSLVDCFTATFCIEQGHELLHNDRDFEPFVDHLGLNVVQLEDPI
jgi:predicted nucleic acid-binding protein